MRPGVQVRGVRQRKLNPKAGQIILREDQIESAEYDSLQNQGKHVTGVEDGEFEEIHLQAALAGQTTGENEGEIPAPPAEQTADFDYDSLYSLVFDQPHSYIRFSQTVEESNGCPYNMTAEDGSFLAGYNQKKAAGAKCSEDAFERIMYSFEDTAEEQAPFASVDNTVIPLDTMRLALKDRVEEKIHKFAQDIYEYWKSRRQDSGNNPLQPSLKFETHQENDDGDPYVCFRRREVRQTRKTRARDIQSADRLRRLRKELEDGRQLVLMTQQRELVKRNLLKSDRDIFEKRAVVKDTKARLGIKTDDEDLINQKPQKRKASDFPMVRPPGSLPRLPGRPDGRPFDAELQLLSDIQENKENLLRREIEEKSNQHQKWNENHVDLTREPLSPVRGPGPELAFRPATAQYQYLMTPPSSVNSDFAEAALVLLDGQNILSSHDESALEESEPIGQPAYRRRIGRNGRLWIDRRGMPSVHRDDQDSSSDRWKYDQDDEDEQPVYERDPFDINAIRFRSTIPLPSHLLPQRGRPDERERAALLARANSNNLVSSRAIVVAPQSQAPT